MVDGRVARGERRRRDLLSAGVALVAHDGISAVTHRAVAAVSGVSVTSVTYHYRTVDELRIAILEAAGDRVLDMMARTARQDRSGRFAARSAGDFAHLLCTAQHDPTSVMLQMLVSAGRDERLRPLADRLNRRAAAVLEPVMGPAAPVAVAAIQGVLLRAVNLGDAEGPEWARASVRSLVAALLPSSA